MKPRNLLGCSLVTAALVVFGSCKEVAGPVAVESVTVSANSLDLVPGETAQLSAVAHDLSGDALDRPISWTSSNTAIVTVTNGLIAALSPGDATITASVEGKSATLPVSVEDGGLVGPAGGTISAIGGMVQLSVPPAAVVSISRLFVNSATDYPPSTRLLRGSAFEIRSNPRGGTSAETVFSQPVVLTIRYDPASIGASSESALSIYQAVGLEWQPVDQSTVNLSSHTVTTHVSAFGVYAILTEPAVASVTIAPSAPALRVRDVTTFAATALDADGKTLSGRTLTWSTSDAGVLKIDASSGVATAVSPGSAVVTVSCSNMNATATVTVTSGAAAKIRMAEGNGQNVSSGGTLPIAPAVVVADIDGFAVAGAHVTFAVTDGGGSITGSDAVSDANGVARVGSWTLGNSGANNVLSATLASAAGSPVLFTATAQPIVSAPPPAPPAAISIFAGDGQFAPPGAAVAIRPAAKVTDAGGKPVPGITVTFSIRSGAGTITGTQAVSDSAGIATIGSWTLGSGGGNSLFATLAGVSGSPLIFVATATTAPAPGAPPPPPPPNPSAGPPAAIALYAGDGQSAEAGSAVPVRPAVKITDANGVGVAGVSVVFSIRSGGGSLDQANSTSDGNGIATVGWTLGAVGGNSIYATATGLSGSPIVFVAIATLPRGSVVRIVTFGDSNTDFGFAGTNPNPVAASYVSSASDVRLSPSATNSPYQLAGKIEARWRAQSSKAIAAVNHGISATSTGVGRTPRGAPNALTQVGGITRFAGEALGAAYPWSGGEPTNVYYASGSIARTQAFSAASNDFAYVSMGTNDPAASIGPSETAANLEWMIDQWVNSGHGADHFILTTLAPANGISAIPQINTLIRSLAARRSVRLVDLAARTSNDNGLTWKSSSDTVDGLHYSETVRDWLADQVASYMLVIVPQ